MTTDNTQDQTATESGASDAADSRQAARAEALKAVQRIKPEDLDEDELDLAAGLQLGIPMEMRDGKPVFVDGAGQPMGFHPSSDWEQFGRVLTGVDLVTGSHAMYDDAENPEKVTGYWYSAHAFFGGTTTEGFDLRATVLTSVAKRLNHDTKYPPGR